MQISVIVVKEFNHTLPYRGQQSFSYSDKALEFIEH